MWPFKKRKVEPACGPGFAQELQLLKPWIDQHRRPAWRPVTQADNPSLPSFFGGAPWLSAGADWPACPACRTPFDLFLQLSSADIPPGAASFGEGLLQVFYCMSCEDSNAAKGGAAEPWRPFSPLHLLRIIPQEGAIPAPRRKDERLARRSIRSWTLFEDLPHPEEFDSLGLNCTPSGDMLQIACPVLHLHLEHRIGTLDAEGREFCEAIGRCSNGNKLGGWPYWVQWPNYPVCKDCGEVMSYVFQIDSFGDLGDYMFGDSGCAHIFQCSRHRHTLAFGWDCC